MYDDDDDDWMLSSPTRPRPRCSSPPKIAFIGPKQNKTKQKRGFNLSPLSRVVLKCYFTSDRPDPPSY